MHHLKGRFIKDPQFSEEHEKQMGELLSKCYVKKTDVKPDMVSYDISRIMVSNIQVNLERLELCSAAVPVIEELH